jgi:hypothetical protein
MSNEVPVIGIVNLDRAQYLTPQRHISCTVIGSESVKYLESLTIRQGIVVCSN